MMRCMMMWTLLCAIAHAKVVELTAENWDERVTHSGKNAFIKFYAPWCGHCKKLKPDWDKLGDQYDDKSNVLIGDVDCTGSAKSLCETYGIQGYPTLKSFWKTMSDDYEGGRDFQSLDKFAKSMKPLCTPEDRENCSEKEATLITTFEKMERKELKEQLDAFKSKVKKAEEEHDALLRTLQSQFEASKNELDDLKKASSFEMKVLDFLLTPKEGKDEL